VLKALHGHPEAGALWEKHMNKILDDLDIVYTTHERSIDRGKIDGKAVVLCRRVDDLAVACSDPTVAQGLIDSIGKIVDLKSQGILSSFNGIDIDIDVDQRREHVNVSCQSYLLRMMKTHGSDKFPKALAWRTAPSFSIGVLELEFRNVAARVEKQANARRCNGITGEFEFL
jgi:hypothetical protein